MSYYAKRSGTITLSDPTDEKKVKEILDNLLDDPEIEIDKTDGYGNVKQFSVYGYSRYNEDYYDDLLKLLPVKEAEIEFVGEDDALWRLRKEENSNCFVEDHGRIIYGEPVRYILVSMDGYHSNTTVLPTLEDAQALMEKEYYKAMPGNLYEEYRGKSGLREKDAILYNNGCGIYTWKIEEVLF